MRAPFRAIEPDRAGVSTAMRGLWALAASRDSFSGWGSPSAPMVIARLGGDLRLGDLLGLQGRGFRSVAPGPAYRNW